MSKNPYENIDKSNPEVYKKDVISREKGWSKEYKVCLTFKNQLIDHIG